MTIRLLLILSTVGCSGPSPAPVETAGDPAASNGAARLVEQLDNADIVWDGTYVDLMPRANGAAAKRLIERGTASDDALISALADPRRFAAAHVILTSIHASQYSVSASEWNGLRVTLLADGQTILYPEQRSALQRRWRDELR